MELLWKCAAIGVSAAALGLSIRKKNEEQALLLGVLAAVLILGGVLNAAAPLTEVIRRLEKQSGVSSDLLSPVVKGLGLSVLGKLAEGFCRDAGHSAAASAMELATACAILCAAAPLITLLADTVFSALQ